MEESSNPNYICDSSYIVIETQSPPWSTRNPLFYKDNWSQFPIKFTFSCFSRYTEWVESKEYPPFPHLLSEYSCPEADKSVVISLRQLFDYQKWSQIMSLELRDLNLTDAQRDELMLAAVKQGVKDLASMPSNHNILCLHLRVDVMHRHVIRREDPNEMETCTICFEEVGQGVQMPCSHVFHSDCIEEWLRIDRRCPLCRFEMPVAMEM